MAVRALCDTGATFTMMSSSLAANIPKRVVGKRHLRIETLGDVLEGKFDVVEVTARGINLPNTLPESYRALQEVVGGCPVLADLAGPGTDSIGRRLL